MPLKALVPAKKPMASSKTAARRTNGKRALRMGALEGVLATAGDTFLRRGDGVYTGVWKNVPVLQAASFSCHKAPS